MKKNLTRIDLQYKVYWDETRVSVTLEYTENVDGVEREVLETKCFGKFSEAIEYAKKLGEDWGAEKLEKQGNKTWTCGRCIIES